MVPGRPSDDCATSPKLFGPFNDRPDSQRLARALSDRNAHYRSFVWRLLVAESMGMEVWRLLGPRCSGLELRLWGNGDDATRCLPNPETFGLQVGVVIRDELRYGFLVSVLRFMQSERKKSPRGKSPAADLNKRVWKASALAAAKSNSISGILTYGHSELACVLRAAST